MGVAPPGEVVGGKPGDETDDSHGEHPGPAAGKEHPARRVEDQHRQSVEELAQLQQQIGQREAIADPQQPSQPGRQGVKTPVIVEDAVGNEGGEGGGEAALGQEETHDCQVMDRIDPGGQGQFTRLQQAGGDGQPGHSGKERQPERLAFGLCPAPTPATRRIEQRPYPRQNKRADEYLGDGSRPAPAELGCPQKKDGPEGQTHPHLLGGPHQPIRVRRQTQQALQEKARKPEQG